MCCYVWLPPKLGAAAAQEVPFGYWIGDGAPDYLSRLGGTEMHSQDDLNFAKRMRELVEDGYIVFSKFGRWRVTEKGLTCLIACAERPVKVTAPQERD